MADEKQGNAAPQQPPAGDQTHQADPQHDLMLRMLYDEQTRLRMELEQVKQKGDEKGGKKEEDEEEGGDEKEGGDDEKDKKDKEKPPLKQRVTGWVREHPIATVLSVIGFIVLIIGTILLVHYLNSYEDTDDAFIDGHTDPISPRINGIVTAVFVENTYSVYKGQLLVELDARDNQVAKEQATANYEQAKASTRAQAPNLPITATDQTTRVQNEDFNVVSGRANVAASEERYRAAIADLHQAEANQANAAREEERYRLLVEKEEVSREQYDQRATDERAQAAVVASRRESAAASARAVTQAEAQLGQALAQAAQAKQDLPRQVAMQREMLVQRKANELAAKAQADQAELNLEYTRIYAPEAGIVGDKQVQVGTQVAPGQEMFAITQSSGVWVTANFKETQIKRMHAKQSVTIFRGCVGTKIRGLYRSAAGRQRGGLQPAAAGECDG